MKKDLLKKRQIEDLEKIIQGPSTPPLRNLIDDVSKTSDDARVQANQTAYNDVFDSQNADIQSKISKAQNDIAFQFLVVGLQIVVGNFFDFYPRIDTEFFLVSRINVFHFDAFELGIKQFVFG